MSAQLAQLEARYPFVAWREPNRVTMPGGSGLGCRVCIAVLGLRADQPERLFASRALFDAHFAGHLRAGG